MSLIFISRFGVGLSVLAISSGCATREVSVQPDAGTRLPTMYKVDHKQTISDIAYRFYGANSTVATHCLWHANPQVRNLGWIDAGQKLSIPVLPDQTTPFSPGEVVHVFPTSVADPPYGFDAAIAEDGSVQLPLAITVHVAGFTPQQAADAIKSAYVPRYYGRWDMAVIRVQQNAPGNSR